MYSVLHFHSDTSELLFYKELQFGCLPACLLARKTFQPHPDLAAFCYIQLYPNTLCHMLETTHFNLSVIQQM